MKKSQVKRKTIIKSLKEVLKGLEKWDKETEEYLKKNGYKLQKNLDDWNKETKNI